MNVFGVMVLVAFACFQCTQANSDDRALTHEQRLMDDLFRNHYGRETNPGNVSVHLELTLRCVMYDPVTHVLTTRAWQYMQWEDFRLKWDPAHYGGVNNFHAHAWAVWHPDIKLYNSMAQEEPDWNVNIIVHSDGSVMWVPPVTYKTLCASSGSATSCKLELGSWTYDAHSVRLTQGDNPVRDTKNYLPECPYKVSNVNTNIKSQIYECCPDQPYMTLTSAFNIEKN